MRAVLILVAVLALGGAAYWMVADNAPVALPEQHNDDNSEQRPEQANPELATSDRHNVTPAPAPKDPTPDPKPEAGTSNEIEPDANPTIDVTLDLHVHNAVSRAPVAPFRWRFVRPGNILRGDNETGSAALALPRAVKGDLLIEADGMQPVEQKAFQTIGHNEPTQRLDVFLTPVPTGQGIKLMVKTLDRQPVPHVRVDAYKLRSDQNANEQTGWDLGQPLWSRGNSKPDGVYGLPPLPAGNYGIVLVATDPEGKQLPLSGYRQTFAVTGSNGFLEDVLLEPACALTIDLRDGQSRPYDPKVYGKTTISLNKAGETGIQRKWTANDDPSGTITEPNTVAGKGNVWLDQPIAPGNYLLEIFVDGDPRVSHSLQLRAEQQVETIYIR